MRLPAPGHWPLGLIAGVAAASGLTIFAVVAVTLSWL